MPNSKFSRADVNDPEQVKDFLNELKSSLEMGKKINIARIFAIPIKLNLNSGPKVFSSEEEIIKYYNIIFDENVTSAIKCQEFNDLGVVTEGILIGRGVVYIGLVDQYSKNVQTGDGDELSFDDKTGWKLKIIAINQKFPWRNYNNKCK